MLVSDFFFFFNDTATTEIYTLSLHDALPISCGLGYEVPDYVLHRASSLVDGALTFGAGPRHLEDAVEDRKSTRLNSSHANISYAVFCLKKKKKRDSLR